MSADQDATGVETGRHSSIAMRLAAVALLVAGTCYSSWVLESVLNTGVDPANSFLSELYAEGKPHRRAFATAEQIAGAMAAFAAVCGLVRGPWRSWTTIGWLALLCFGAATIADTLLPLRACPPGRICGAGRELFPQLHQPHAFTSTLAVTSIAVAAFVLTGFARRSGCWPVVRTAGLAALVVGILATLWMLVGDNLSGHFALGIAQRVQVGSISLWMMAFAVALSSENTRGGAAD
ncbi:DUF998 domain-containing protein [Nocardia concava]|uniref:DUF998 domain-containing protein n=1 Tax=Nocardia concava TaxID=257281 RepID=UPI00031AB3C7|nr:DUF998 domain-containing protein [Nocardia concava]